MIVIIIVVYQIAIGSVSAQNFKQVQNFNGQTFGQQQVQPELRIQPQRNPSDINDEVSQKFRQSIAQSIRDTLAQQNIAPSNANLPANYPEDPLNDPNIPIVEITNKPLLRPTHRPRPRPQPIHVQEQPEEELENYPIAVAKAERAHRLRNKTPNTPVRAQVAHTVEEDAETAKYLRKQAENAQYSFDSSVHDTINDQSITRTETRDGLALTGMYSYSDGFFRRTVNYVADENGYRVVNEQIEPIGDGPQYNPEGKADVSSSLIGEYSITADDVRDTRVKEPLRRHEVNEDEIHINKAPQRKHRFEVGRV